MDSQLSYSIVTGSSQGLGKALAYGISWKTPVLVSLPGEGLEQLAHELSEIYPVEVLYYETDFSKHASVYEFAEWVNSRYKVNILVNNVGIGGTFSFTDMDATYIDSLISINVRTTALLTKLLLENLNSHPQAYVLNVASIASFSPIPYKTVYPASKAFIYSFSRSLKEELRKTNVSISVLHPGPMMTNDRVTQLIIWQGRLGKFGLLPTEQIARIAISNLFHKRAVIIPGWLNKVTWVVMKTVPTWVRMRLGSALLKKELEFSTKVLPRHGVLEPEQMVSWPQTSSGSC